MTVAPSITAAGLAALALSAAAAPAQAAPGVRVQDAAARLVVIPEARRDVSVTVRPGDPRLPPLRTRQDGEVLVVEGGLQDRIESCGAINMNFGAVFNHRRGDPAPGQRVIVRGVGMVPLDALPVITARVPMDASVAAGGAVWGEVGPTERLRLAKSGCGDFRVADVRGEFDIDSHGSGDTGAGRVGKLRAAMNGSGDLTAGDVAREADVAIVDSGDVRLGRVGGAIAATVRGSGDLRAAELQGPLNASVAGSGDVQVEGGRAPVMAVRIAGSGDVRFGGEAGSLSAQIAGSGDVRVSRVTGPVAKSVHGSGEVYIGR